MRNFHVIAALCALSAYAGGANAPDGSRAMVNADSVPVHSETSKASRILRTVTRGEVFTVAYSVDTGADRSCGLEGAQRGYVLCNYLTREAPPKPEAGEAELPPVLTPAIRRAGRSQAAVRQPIPAPTMFTLEQAALISAAKLGNVAGIQLALQKGAIASGRDPDGKTALLWAASGGHVDAVKELISAGSDFNAADNLGWTPLEAAVWARHPEVVALLLEQRIEVNPRDSEGRTPLMHAAQYGDLTMVRDLLAKGGDPNASNRFNQTPLMFATLLSDTAAAEALIDSGADVSARDAAGRSVLINTVLAADERTANVQLLVGHGADVNARDNEGRTALAWAVKKGHTAIAQLLKKAGAVEW